MVKYDFLSGKLEKSGNFQIQKEWQPSDSICDPV